MTGLRLTVNRLNKISAPMTDSRMPSASSLRSAGRRVHQEGPANRVGSCFLGEARREPGLPFALAGRTVLDLEREGLPREMGIFSNW